MNRFAIVFVLLLFASCAHKPCNDPDVVYYEESVAPILNSSCGSSTTYCHHSPTDDNEGVDLSSYAAVMKGFELVRPGKPDKSEMIEVITEQKMPPDTSSFSISEQNLNILIKWIDQGAQEAPCINN